MKILLIELSNGYEHSGDVRIPYINGILKARKSDFISARVLNIKFFEELIKKISPDLIIAGGDIGKIPEDIKFISSRECLNILNLKDEEALYKYGPDFRFDIYESNQLKKIISGIVLSNNCKYSKAIKSNELFRNIELPDGCKQRGCSFCCDIYSDSKWEIQNTEYIKSIFLSWSYIAKKDKIDSIRIMGERFTSNPQRIFSILKDISVKNVNIIITLRPEILLSHFANFEKALMIARSGSNKMILCSSVCV